MAPNESAGSMIWLRHHVFRPMQGNRWKRERLYVEAAVKLWLAEFETRDILLSKFVMRVLRFGREFILVLLEYPYSIFTGFRYRYMIIRSRGTS
jgi:hypothetical protein